MSTAYLLPDGVGNYNGFTVDGAATTWQAINDPVGVPNDATYIYAIDPPSGDRYASVTIQDTDKAIINSVTVYLRVALIDGAVPASGNVKVLLRIGGVDYESADIAIAATPDFADYSSAAWATNPATLAAWAAAAINSLEIGIHYVTVGSVTCYVSQMYLAVDYTPVPPPLGGGLAGGIHALAGGLQ